MNNPIVAIVRRYTQWRRAQDIRKMDILYPPKSQAFTNPIRFPWGFWDKKK